METATMTLISAASLLESSPQEDEADLRLTLMFDSDKFREQGNFHRILEILEGHPKLARHTYKSIYSNIEMVPLCCILTSKVSCKLEIFRAIHDLYPQAVVLPQGRNRETVLHFACRHNASTEVVKFITSKNPSAIFTLNGSGRPPLESLLPGLKTPAGIQTRLKTLIAIFRASPEAIAVRNGRGQTLLEAALHLGGWSTVKALEYIAERSVQPEEASRETLVELLASVEKPRRLRPTAKQSIQFALLRAVPSLWAD